ncbi:MAG: hypothetical protein AAB647_03995 [Patescibacteria group bacterium]
MKTWFLLMVASVVITPQLVMASLAYPYPSPYQTGESNLDATVVYDGEGEATVAAELEIGGVGSELKSLTLDIPGTSVRVLRVFYRYQSTSNIESANCEADVVYDDYPTDTKQTTYHCVSLLEAKADKAADSVRETVTFPVPLAAGDTARLTLAYKTSGTVTKTSTGVSNFSYLTPAVALDLASVRVRVDVASDLYLEGGKSETNYSSNDGSLAEGLAVATLQSFSNKYELGLDGSYSDSSAFIKSTTNLDPNETYTVTGTYASSWFALSWPEFLIALIVLLLLIVLVIWGERRAAAHQKA